MSGLNCVSANWNLECLKIFRNLFFLEENINTINTLIYDKEEKYLKIKWMETRVNINEHTNHKGIRDYTRIYSRVILEYRSSLLLARPGFISGYEQK